MATEEKKNIFQLAIIDLSEAEESDEKFHKVAKELVTAFHDLGFAYVSNCKGIDSEELLIWTKWFFNLPKERKMRLAKQTFNPNNPNIYHGYFPVNPEIFYFKEGIEFGVFNNVNVTGRHLTADEVTNQSVNKDGRKYMRNILSENNVWPVTDDEISDRKFQEVIKRHHEAYQSAGQRLVHLMVAGLGFERTKFDNLFGPKRISTLRLMHYPTQLNDPDKIPEKAWDGEQVIVTGEHKDSCILTLLSTFENRGLQIKPPSYDEWLDVPVMKDHLVVNIGALLQQLVEDRMTATNHRVIDIGSDRYSAAFLDGFNYDSSITKTFYGRPNTAAGKCEKYGPWMINRRYAAETNADFGVED